MRIFKVGICGAGVVGGGVANILRVQRPLFQAQGFDFVVKTIATRDAVCIGFTPEATTRVTANVDDVKNDDELDIVVEAMGGIDAAKSVLLDSKAHVVTANKALLAHAFPAVNRAFRARRGGRRLGFEASVAGGIPVIRALQSSLACDTITGVAGIMNGTTNFILSKMDAEGKAYGDVLREAQEAGFAEADPTADVEGHDAANKLVLLTALSTGVYVPPSKIRTTGITDVTDWDFAAWKEAGCTVKLVGSMEVFDPPTPAASGGPPSDGKLRKLLDLFVSPSIVRKDAAFGITNGAMNLVRVRGEHSGVTSYYGAGAGRYPTANSIVADMVNIARGSATGPAFPRPRPERLGVSMKVDGGLKRDWYLRGPAASVELATLALWRQGHGVVPIGPPGPTRGARVEGVSHAALAGLLKRVAAKGRGGGDAAGAGAAGGLGAESVVAFPILQGVW